MTFLCSVIGAYEIILWVRVIIGFVFMFKPGWAPPSGLRPVLDAVYALVDPPVNALRKVVPQPFNFPLDLAFLVWFIIIIVAHGIVCGTGGALL